MTREDAKIFLYSVAGDLGFINVENYTCQDGEKMREAIKALEEPRDVFDEYGNYKYPSDVELTEPNTATSMPCEDAISKEAVLDAIDTYDKFGYTETGCFVREPKGDYVLYIHYDDVIKCIKNAPLVTPQQKMGHWIYKQYGSYPEQGDYHCSECDGIDNRIPAYCPNCGAKMQEVEE